jgi:solute carrier family 35 (adenosine 3'-phospho 5'-phosphosulfate transporter), member B3
MDHDCCSSIISALGFSTLQEKVFNIDGFTYGGWMTFITYCTYAACGWIETIMTGNYERHGSLKVRLGVFIRL